MFWHRTTPTRRRMNRSVPLRLEGLERRWCPSCTVMVTGSTLHIIGDAGNNNVAIVDNGAAGIVVTCDGVAHPAATGIRVVLVNTLAGNDTVTYSRSATGGNFTGRLNFIANLGSGNDAFTANFNGNKLVGTARVTFNVNGNAGDDTITFNAGTTAAGVDIASGARLKLRADGGSGKDNITVAYAGLLNGNLDVKARGGDGDDTVAATIAVGTGSTGSLKADLKGGPVEEEEGAAGSDNDTVNLTVTGPIALGARADLRADGGAGNDKVTVSYSGLMNGKLSVKARGGSGDDLVTGTVALATGSTGSVKADVKGGPAEEEDNDTMMGGTDNDTVTLTVTGPIAAGARADLSADGGAGNDKVNVSYSGVLNGKLNFNASGGNGDDVVTGTVTLGAGSNGSLKGLVSGGNGNDNLTFNITGATANVAIDAVLDGGPGTDTCVATANVKVKNCEH